MYYYLTFNDKECLYRIENANKKITNRFFGKRPFKLYKWTRLWTDGLNPIGAHQFNFSAVIYTVHPRYFKLRGSLFFLSLDSEMAIRLKKNTEYKIHFKAKIIEKIIEKYPALFDAMLAR